MDHVAIMSQWFNHRGSSMKSGKKEWGFVEKILAGTKTIESRWYKNKYQPWDKVFAGDIIYFKNSPGLVEVKAEVKKVIQFSELNPSQVKEILQKYGKDIGIKKNDIPNFFQKFREKKYCVLMFLEKPQKIKPFQINKKGFGSMASWITINNIDEIQQIGPG